MSKIDRQYLDLIEDITVDGQDVQSRNSLTRKVFHRTLTFDSTPLISVRRTAWKSCLKEMEYFLNGGTHLDELDPKVRHWWKDFCTVTPNKMHYSYGHCFRKLYNPSNKVIKVPIREYKDNYIPFKQELIEISTLENHGEMTGSVFGEGQNKFKVLEIVGVRKTNKIYRIQFLNNGFIKEYRQDVIKDLRVKNPYTPSVYGVGYFGEPEQHPLRKQIHQVWFHMMGRCYNSKDNGYRIYGERGVSVCKRWHGFDNFLNDFSKLDGYEQWRLDSKNFQLDKDHYGSVTYSPSTCIILPAQINTKYSKTKGKFVLKNNKEYYEFLSEVEVANFLKISTSSVKVHSKKMIESGYRLEFYQNSKDYNYRNEIFIDQLSEMIKNIKDDQQSRRNVITTWIPNHVQSGIMNPTNCHGSLIQTDVNPETKELTLFMYQRSCDVMLGLPHNILQYYAFLLYLSHQANLVPGKLIITLGNTHIYEKHFEAADKVRYTPISQIETPQLTYNPTSDNFKAEDFNLDGEYSPLIKESLELIV